jgi:hypothetical protein
MLEGLINLKEIYDLNNKYFTEADITKAFKEGNIKEAKDKIYYSMHERLKEKLPFLTEGQINVLTGVITERVMDWYFIKTGWTKIVGEVGRNGIDGLYIKRDKAGNIKQVLVVESKYNTSSLQDTKAGKQMSKEWLNTKLDALIKQYPDNKDYMQIKNMINEGKYRARLFNLKEIGPNLKIQISKIESKGMQDVNITNLKGNEQYKIAKIKYDLTNPSSKFEKEVVSAYNESVNDIIKNYKNYVKV